MDKEGHILKTDPFKEYIKQTEPNKRDKGYAWQTAIGLQAGDGLSPFLSHRISIWPYTKTCLAASTNMPGRYAPTT